MLDDLVAAAVAAGAAILDIYARDDFGASVKGDGSPVTRADAAAEVIILSALAKIAPDIPVIAEEAVAGGYAPVTGSRFFLVDPLDGTKEFIGRNGDFTVNIALIEDGVPVLGVVYTPARGDVFVGEAGVGARYAKLADGGVGDWAAIRVRPAPVAGLAVLASRSHLTDETRDFIAKFKVADLVPAGSSLKFCKLAAGEADLYPRLGRTMEWDTAAGDAVLRAAGGAVRTMDGRPLVYGKRGQADDVDFANPWFVASGLFDPFAVAA